MPPVLRKTAVGNRLIAPLVTISRKSFRNDGFKAMPGSENGREA